MNSLPEELDEITRTITRLEIEREAIKRDGDTDKEQDIAREIADLQVKRDEFTLPGNRKRK